MHLHFKISFLKGRNLKVRFVFKLRSFSNRLFGPLRIIPLVIKGKDKFTIISNNCWGGFVYQHYSIDYKSPTIGLYFFSDDYIKFVYNLKYYLNIQPHFITYKESRYGNILEKSGGLNIVCPIGVFDDIEVIFLHYKSPEEALRKWNRRKERIQWDNLFFKMSEQNGCTLDHLAAFDRLPTNNKIVFTTKDYHLSSQIIFKEYLNQKYIYDDVLHFRRYIHLNRWILHKNNFKKQ